MIVILPGDGSRIPFEEWLQGQIEEHQKPATNNDLFAPSANDDDEVTEEEDTAACTIVAELYELTTMARNAVLSSERNSAVALLDKVLRMLSQAT